MRLRDPQQVKAIIAGRRTQFRFLVSDDEPTCRYEVGRSYAVQLWENAKDEFGARSWKWVTKTRVRVQGIRQQDLHEITPEELEAEGYKHRRDLFRALGYMEHVRGEVPVWVLTFAIDRDHHPRLLHRDSSHGYTENVHQALPDEPESVDAETLKTYGLEGRQGDVLRHAKRQQTWDEQALSDRLAALEGEAEQFGLHRELARIRSAIENAEQKRRRKAA